MNSTVKHHCLRREVGNMGNYHDEIESFIFSHECCREMFIRN